MNKKIIFALGICALFLLVCINSVCATDQTNTVEKTKVKPSLLSLTGDDFRIKVRGDKIWFMIKFPKSLSQKTFQASIEVTITDASGEVLNHFSDESERFSSTFSIQGIHSEYNRFGSCKVNVKVTGIGDDEGLYKELTAEGIVFFKRVSAFGDTF